MSGGRYDYAYAHIEELARELELCPDKFTPEGNVIENPPTDAHRVRFKRILELVAEAARAVEWVDSGDSSLGDDHAAIDAILKEARRTKRVVLGEGIAYRNSESTILYWDNDDGTIRLESDKRINMAGKLIRLIAEVIE